MCELVFLRPLLIAILWPHFVETCFTYLVQIYAKAIFPYQVYSIFTSVQLAI
jgi:hypothetical protein